MADELRFEIVPISEVPAAENDDEVTGHDGLAVDDVPIPAGSLRIVPGQEANCFEVRGLPRGQKAWIRQAHAKCQLLLEVRSGESEWLGDYLTVKAALQALSDKLMPGLFL